MWNRKNIEKCCEAPLQKSTKQHWRHLPFPSRHILSVQLQRVGTVISICTLHRGHSARLEVNLELTQASYSHPYNSSGSEPILRAQRWGSNPFCMGFWFTPPPPLPTPINYIGFMNSQWEMILHSVLLPRFMLIIIIFDSIISSMGWGVGGGSQLYSRIYNMRLKWGYSKT